jgi:hypothetical protein
MGVTVTLKYLKDIGGGRWEYRRRVPESVKIALGKSESKRVFDARTPAEVARGHAKVDAAFMVEVQAATRGVTHPVPFTVPRKAFEAALKRAEGLIAETVGLDDDDARAVVADGIASAYPADPEDGAPLVCPLMMS